MENGLSSSNDFGMLERQKTSESAPERRITVACDQNSDDPQKDVRVSADPIAAYLTRAGRLWVATGDRRALRGSLLDLLRALDE
jgi:hypothetical protein